MSVCQEGTKRHLCACSVVAASGSRLKVALTVLPFQPVGGGGGASQSSGGDQQAPLAAAAGLDDTRMDITQLNSRGGDQDPLQAAGTYGPGPAWPAVGHGSAAAVDVL